MAAVVDDLLPNDFAEFRSVEYWDRFFRKRGGLAFEWYGSWRELRPLVRNACGVADSAVGSGLGGDVLVPGCGNSALSADMYDDGFTRITNVDFSRVAIASMLAQHVRARPSMRWLVGDMMATAFPTSSFDTVVDKGGLDALMGEPGVDGDTAGARFLAEIRRLVRPSGRFIAVSLLQPHVLALAAARLTDGWAAVSVSRVPPTLDMAQSPLQPFVIVAVRGRDDCSVGPPPPIATTFTRDDLAHAGGPSAAHLAAVVAGIASANVARAAAGRSQSSPAATARSGLPVSFESLVPGGRHVLELSTGGPDAPPRFGVVVLDAPASGPTPRLACAVFLVPQGREHEWMFASPEGQQQLGASCHASRLLLVSLRRGHTYPGMAALQAELSPLMVQLMPTAARAAALVQRVPYLTTPAPGGGLGRRVEVDRATSPLSGVIVVEDVELSAGATVRRLVFLATPSLVQSEAVLMTGGGDTPPTVDRLALPCGYHGAIVAGLCVVAPTLAAASVPGAPPAAMVIIGLGGGGLPCFLHDCFAVHVTVVELDPVVATLAAKHFGFRATPRLRVTLGDGLTALADLARASPSSLDVIVIDAGGGDPAEGMSCPPAAFLTPACLADCHVALRPGGLLAINVVTRSPSLYASAQAALHAAFGAPPRGAVYHLCVSDDVNRVILAVKGPAPPGLGLPAECATALLQAATQRWPSCDDVIDLIADITPCGGSAGEADELD